MDLYFKGSDTYNKFYTNSNFLAKNVVTSPIQLDKNIKKTAIGGKNFWDENKHLIYATGGLVIGAGAVGLIMLRGNKNGRRLIASLQGQIDELQKAAKNLQDSTQAVQDDLNAKIGTLTKNLADSQSELAKAKAVSAKFNDVLAATPEEIQKLAVKQQEQYANMVAGDIKLSYDPMKPLVNGSEITRSKYSNYHKLLDDFVPTQKAFSTDEILDTKMLSSKLDNMQVGEVLDVPLTQKVVNATKMSDAYTIDTEQMKVLNQTVNCDKALAAGDTANWSQEKIARDIFQNFYDNHNHTLDGVKVSVKKTGASNYKIRIEGQGTYNCEYISGDGLSSKSDNLYNAGGFGEGLKMVNVGMLRKNLTDKITYGSANWQYDITAGNKYMQRTLRQVPGFEGNFVEFETKNPDFAKKLIEATNYFEHSKNPDFLNTTYKNADFGVEFLGANKNGNLYYTQRFEFDDKGNWGDKLEGLNLYLRKKIPAFETGRDRTTITRKGLETLLEEYTKTMTEQEALDLIMKMQSVWEHVPNDVKPKAHRILLKALCKKFGYGSDKIDFSNSKLVAMNSWGATSNEIERVRDYGYKICDNCLESVGMPTINEILKSYSVHKPLQPTQLELKKIHLLGEASKIVSELYDNSRPQGLNEAISAIKKIDTDKLFIPGKTLIDLDSEQVFKKYERLIDFDAIGEKFASLEKPFTKKYGNVEQLPEAQQKILTEKAMKIASRLYIKPYIKNLIKNSEKLTTEEQKLLVEFLQTLDKQGVLTDSAKKVVSNMKLSEAVKESSEALLKQTNPHSPVYIFDRMAEKSDSTLAEAMIEGGKYLGHWVDRKHLNEDSFSENLATWLHEMLHQYAGDGSSTFGYKLTDLLGDTFKLTPEQHSRLYAIQKVYDSLKA